MSAVTFVASAAEAGGAEHYMESLAAGLGPRAVERVIVPGEGELADGLRAAGHRVEVVRFGRRAGLLATAARMRRALRGADGVVHANGSRAALVCALAAGRRRPVVWLRVDRTLDGRLGDLVARRCARIVAISESALGGLGARARERADVVYPGVAEVRADRAAGRELVRSLLGCEAEDEVVVVSGRLAPGKGQRELLAAAPAVLERRPRARFALLGGPSAGHPGFEGELRALADRLGIAERVHLLGRRPPGVDSVADAIRFVSGCELLAAPSVRERPYGWQEGFGLAVAEAMWVGTPVVAYRHGSLPEVLGGCGELVAEGDVAALGAAIAALLADPARRRELAERAAERARLRFRRADAVAAMRELYAAVATSR